MINYTKLKNHENRRKIAEIFEFDYTKSLIYVRKMRAVMCVSMSEQCKKEKKEVK
jgi:hypothetical protein